MKIICPKFHIKMPFTYNQITREFLGLKKRNFQGIALYEHKHIGRFSKSAFVYL